MTTLYFVRHAKVLYTEDDRTRQLSSEGKESLVKLEEVFRDIHIDSIVSSPYDRAVNTIQGIADDKGLSIECIEDLRERKVAHSFIDDFKSFAENQWKDFNYKLDGGESLQEVRDRGLKAINQVLKSYNGQSIIIGTHGTFLGVMLNHYDSKHDFEFWKSIKMPDIFKLVVSESGDIISIDNIVID